MGGVQAVRLKNVPQDGDEAVVAGKKRLVQVRKQRLPLQLRCEVPKSVLAIMARISDEQQADVRSREMDYHVALIRLRNILKYHIEAFDVHRFLDNLTVKNAINMKDEEQIKKMKDHEEKIDAVFYILFKTDNMSAYNCVLKILKEIQRDDNWDAMKKCMTDGKMKKCLARSRLLPPDIPILPKEEDYIVVLLVKLVGNINPKTFQEFLKVLDEAQQDDLAGKLRDQYRIRKMAAPLQQVQAKFEDMKHERMLAQCTGFGKSRIPALQVLYLLYPKRKRAPLNIYSSSRGSGMGGGSSRKENTPASENMSKGKALEGEKPTPDSARLKAAKASRSAFIEKKIDIGNGQEVLLAVEWTHSSLVPRMRQRRRVGAT
ncbi:unnamed protein product [Darwinula stevensoni]|uniref:Uncharacterized protein n=1 Tax=Darwinula stevensoni TaxID=69355 RepID=A0A7R9A5F3_9CRUS|nr:unnamed protein product [Darwinula stevensoni]CAG0891896.1 unnamed protein product [Darwinula stevensoni]